MTDTRRLREVGFWFDPSQTRLPRPQALVPSGLTQERRRRIAAYLRQAPVCTVYRGYSSCRFRCGEPDERMGNGDQSDGIWVWPEGLAHYVLLHDVRLPDEFVHHVELCGAPQDMVSTPVTGETDVEWWITWGRDNGAGVDLTEPWRALDDAPWELRLDLADALTAKLGASHAVVASRPFAVARREKDDAVLYALTTTSELAVVSLGVAGGTPSVTILDGWHVWNAHRQSGGD